VCVCVFVTWGLTGLRGGGGGGKVNVAVY